MKSEKKNTTEKNNSNFYKIFQNSKTQKIINIIFSIIFLIGFSYYYYYRDYFEILLIASIGGLLFLLIYLVNKKNISQINFKDAIHKKIKINLFKISLIFTLISIIWVNTNLFINSRPNLDYISQKVFLVQLNILYQVIGLLIFNLIFILILWSIGSKIIKLLQLKLTNSEEFVFGFSFGAIPLILSTFLLTTTALLHTKYILITLLIWILFSYKEIINNLKKIFKLEIKLGPSDKFINLNFLKKITLIIFFIIIISLFINTIYPQPVNYDSLHTNYNVPNIFLEQHKSVNFPLFSFANIPKNIEMLYINIMATVGPRFLSHIQLIYLILTLSTIYLFCKKFFDEKTGILAIIIFFFSISFFYLSNGVKVDLSLIFYSSIILYAFFNWLKNSETKWAIILGSLFGLSFGIKYNAIFLFLSVGTIILIIIIYKIIKKSNIKKYIFQSFLILLFTIIFFSPWLIRDKIKFNNYLYPYLITYEEETVKVKQDLMIERQDEYTEIMIQNGESKIQSIINLPKIYLKKNEHGVLQNFNPLFILLIPLIFLYKKNKREKILLTISLVYFILWIWKANFRIWYAGPVFIILSIILSLAIIKTKFLLKNNIVKISASTYLIICLILINSINSTRLTQIYYISGLISETEYLNQIPIYKISQKLNNVIKKDEKVLLLLEMRTGFIKNNNENAIIEHKLEQYFNNKIYNTPKEIHEQFKKENIKYIIYKNRQEKHIRNLPYLTLNFEMLNNKSYKNILNSVNLFNDFRVKYLKNIECHKNKNDIIDDICLYKIL